MNYKKLLCNFDRDFPEEECVIKAKENAIYEGEKMYLCAIIDKRFEKEICFKIMKPYKWIGDETTEESFKGLTGFAWINESGYYVDHYKNPIHDEDEFVIAFMPYEDDESSLNLLFGIRED